MNKLALGAVLSQHGLFADAFCCHLQTPSAWEHWACTFNLPGLNMFTRTHTHTLITAGGVDGTDGTMVEVKVS